MDYIQTYIADRLYIKILIYLNVFAKVALTKCHKLGGFSSDVLPPSSGGWRPKIRVLAGCFPLRAVRVCLFHASVPAAGASLPVFSALGL